MANFGATRDEPVAYDDAMEDETPTDWILCYLVCTKEPGGGYLGGVLLTDHRARPLHFAFVQPIRPTTMQRLLYGSVLDEHIRIDVIAQKLWEGLPNPPDVLFVDTHDLIEAERVTGGVPTAYLAKVPQSSDNLSALKFDAGRRESDHRRVGEIVGALEIHLDLVEPFTRIKEALKEGLKSSN
jgi:hypothetical protein